MFWLGAKNFSLRPWVDLSLLLATSKTQCYEVESDMAVRCFGYDLQIWAYGLATRIKYTRHHGDQKHLFPLMYSGYHRDHISLSQFLQHCSGHIVCLFFYSVPYFLFFIPHISITHVFFFLGITSKIVFIQYSIALFHRALCLYIFSMVRTAPGPPTKLNQLFILQR